MCSASPETILRKAREFISVAQSATGRTWPPTRCVIPFVFLLQPAVSRPPHNWKKSLIYDLKHARTLLNLGRIRWKAKSAAAGAIAA